MTTEGSSSSSNNNKCGLGSLLSMSCKGRAEAFARRLHSKLVSLGGSDEADEGSWLGGGGRPVAAQPRHRVLKADVGQPESTASEQEEEVERPLVNGDPLRLPNGDDTKNKQSFLRSSTSNDSDSDCSFYDTENEVDQQRLADSSEDNLVGLVHEDSFASISDGTPQACSPLEEDPSTLSLNDGEEEEGDCSLVDDVARLGDNDVSVDGDEGVGDDDDDDDGTDQQEKESICLSPAAGDTTAPPTFACELDLDGVDDGGSSVGTPAPRVRRCSSLKTGKTPPGTPAAKKIVRFADVLGLDLADVRTFLDEVPKVPVSAFEDLPDADLCDSPDSDDLHHHHHQSTEPAKLLVPLFPQPATQPDFQERVREHQVCLETALVDDPVSLSVAGTVRVRNLDFHKSVHIRYSLDAWRTHADVRALYLDGSCDGFSDRFAFLLYAHHVKIGQRLEFACRFQCRGCQYWDSNGGANYCFQCLPAGGGRREDGLAEAGVGDWGGASFY